MFAVMLVAGAMAALSACDFADQFASFMPKGFRQPTPEPPAPEAEADLKELIRATPTRCSRRAPARSRSRGPSASPGADSALASKRSSPGR
jgi:hypothetical protein